MFGKRPEPPAVTDGGLGASRKVLAARLTLLILAVAALVAGWAIALRDRPDGGARYVCPMHPEVVANGPSTCPICGMALEPKDAQSTAAMHGKGSMNDDVEAVENVRKHNVIDFVRRRSLLPHTREMRGQAWLEDDGTIGAVFYKDQIDVMAAEEQGTFSLARSPDVAVPVRRAPDAPESWDESTSRIRFRPEKSPLHPGDVGWVELARHPRDVLAVPAAAILQSSEGPYVLAWTGVGYQFEKRPVEIGETFTKYGFAVVLSGLRANERVVSRAAFFLDAERRLANRAVEGGAAIP